MARYPLNLPTQLKQEAEVLAGREGVSLNQFILWAVADRVGALRESLGDPAFPAVRYQVGAAGRPVPTLRGTRVRIQALALAQTRWGMSAEEIASEYDLPKRAVREALAFYDAHQAEVDDLIAAEDALEAAGDAAAPAS